MAYVGNPIDTTNTFQSLAGKRFNGDGSTTDFTLDVAPGNVLDIEVFVGNVRQDPNSAYTLSGTTLSFTGAPPSGTNNIYVVHQAKSVGTIDVPAGGVAAGSLATSVLTGQTDIGADIADADLFLVDDGAGGTLRKTAASRIKTYIGDNTASFMAFLSGDQSVSDNSATKVQCNTELIDTDNAYDNSSNYRFTVPSGKGGKYFFFAQVRVGTTTDFNVAQMQFYINGSERAFSSIRNEHDECFTLMHSRDLSAGEYVELYFYQNQGGTINIDGDSASARTYFGGYRLVT